VADNVLTQAHVSPHNHNTYKTKYVSKQHFLFFSLLLLFPFLNAASDDFREPRLKAHELMSPADLARVFQVDSHDQVPDYQIVNIHHRRQKRDLDHQNTHEIALEAFGKRFELELNKNLNLVPPHRNLNVLFAEQGKEEIEYYPTNSEDDETEDIGEVYQDESNMAALLLYKHGLSDEYQMDGTIGDDLVVKPLPPSLRGYFPGDAPPRFSESAGHWTNQNIHSESNVSRSHYLDDLERELPVDYAFLDEDDEVDYNSVDGGYSLTSMRRRRRSAECESCVKTGAHIVYKRIDVSEDHDSDYTVMETDQLPYKSSSNRAKEGGHSRQKRQAPYMIFPEILVIVDYDGYRLHGEDNVAIKRYVISFWNGVDLRYKLLQGPSVKISIAGIIISRGRDATPYLERNRVGRDAIDAASALTDMGKYLFLERRLPVYDIAVAITKLDMCRRKTRYGDCNRGTAGFAYVGGACVVNKRLEKVNSVAIVEDTGGFSGIIVAAHELGHLLGAVHDGSPPPSYLGGPGAVKCRWEDGYIMSDLRHTSKGFKWSICTVLQFHHFLNGETATCMYNSPHEEESLPRVLPGKLLSLDAQCRKDRGTSACFKDDRVCAQLFCFDAGSGYCVSYRPAAEGSRCGDNHMCLNGKCVSDHENAIDYGDGFLRRTGSVEVETYVRKNGYQDTSSSTRSWWNQITTDSTTSPFTTASTTTIPASTSTTARTTSRKPEPTTTASVKHHNQHKTTLSWWKRFQQKTKQRLAKLHKNKSSTTPKFEPDLTTPHTTSTSTTSTTTKRTTTTTVSTSPSTTTRSSSSTTSLTTHRSYKVRTKSRQNHDKNHENDSLNKLGSSEECKDRINNIAGSMSCKAFLRSFAYQYCRHKYIRKNCCASHSRFCSGAALGR